MIDWEWETFDNPLGDFLDNAEQTVEWNNGFCNVAVATAYAVAAEMHPQSLSGTAMGFTNMASVIVGASFQPLIGRLLDLGWQGTMLHGAPLYSVDNFKSAMTLLPLCAFVALVLCLFIPESFPKTSDR